MDTCFTHSDVDSVLMAKALVRLWLATLNKTGNKASIKWHQVHV